MAAALDRSCDGETTMDNRHRMQTFGDHVNQFAQTVDIVPENVYGEVLDLIEGYLRSNLKAGFFAVVVEKVVRLQPHLVAEWPRDRNWWLARVRNDEGVYIGQTGLAYALGKPLWIVGANRAELKRAEAYEDLLNNALPNDIPRYEEIEAIGARTSIILPLSLDNEHFGIINVESTVYLAPTDAWLCELKKLASSIAILYRLKSINKLQTKSTLEAKDRLEHGEFVPVVRRRVMFLASSARADREVVDLIHDLFSEYKQHFEMVHWTDPAFGNIHENIWERISTCMYGTCYFSEPAGAGATHGFFDNPNVLFEAGMLFALRKARRSPLQGILLIREPDAPVIPFDLTAEFMLLVPRTPNGQLEREKLRSQLQRHISFLLKISTAT